MRVGLLWSGVCSAHAAHDNRTDHRAQSAAHQLYCQWCSDYLQAMPRQRCLGALPLCGQLVIATRTQVSEHCWPQRQTSRDRAMEREYLRHNEWLRWPVISQPCLRATLIIDNRRLVRGPAASVPLFSAIRLWLRLPQCFPRSQQGNQQTN